MREYRKVLVPYDFSNHARLALDTALDFVRLLKSGLHLLHAIQPPFYANPGFGDVPATVMIDMRESLLGSSSAPRTSEPISS